MADLCTWLVFQAHPTPTVESEDDHPEFFGTFVCPASRSEPEQLLREILGNRQLFLTEVTTRRKMSPDVDWGMNERLKAQVDQQGYGFSLIKMHARPLPLE